MMNFFDICQNIEIQRELGIHFCLLVSRDREYTQGIISKFRILENENQKPLVMHTIIFKIAQKHIVFSQKQQKS